jgi:hypothetical protein
VSGLKQLAKPQTGIPALDRWAALTVDTLNPILRGIPGPGTHPTTPTLSAQTGVIYQGSGVPGNAYGNNGDYYFRTDTPANQAQLLYVKAAGVWTVVSFGGSGTVSSVGLTAPSALFAAVTGSPVTTSGTLGLVLATQAAGTFLGGPVSGAAATPTFRAITSSDTGAQIDFMTGRRWGSVSHLQPAGATIADALIVWGMQNPNWVTQSGTGFGSSLQEYRSFFYTSTVSGTSPVGWLGPYNETRPYYGAVLQCSGLMPVETTGCRTVHALASADPTGVPGAASGTSAIFFIGVWTDPSYSPNYLVASGDGSNYTMTDTGVAFGSVDQFRFKIDWTARTSFTVTLYLSNPYTNPDNFTQAFSVTKNTNIPAPPSATDMGIVEAIAYLGGASSHTLYHSSTQLQQNA